MIVTSNAVIEDAVITIQSGRLTAWLFVEHPYGNQGFGGYALYLPKSFTHHNPHSQTLGHFIWRVMEVVGVSNWSDLKGKHIRIQGDPSKITAIGNILKEKWYTPEDEFQDE